MLEYKNNDDVEDIDPIEEEIKRREGIIKEKPLSFFTPSKENLEYTWDMEFTEKMEPLVEHMDVNIDTLMNVMKHHVCMNAFSKEYIKKYPECVMYQIEKYREKELQGTTEMMKEVKKHKYIETNKKFDWNNKKYVDVL
jgi:hypothetical protein